MKRIILKIIMLLILLMITCSNFAFAIDKDSIKCLDEDGNACTIETKVIRAGHNSSTAETTITVLKSNNIYVNEVLTLSLTSTRGLWNGELNVVQTAYNDSEMNVKLNKEEIDYEYDGYNSVNIKKLEIVILKEGTYTYSFKIKDSQLTETINITIEGVTRDPGEVWAEEKEKNLENAYKNIPSSSASADEIKTFLESCSVEDDKKEERLKQMKSVDKDTLNAWYKKITDARSVGAVERSMYEKTYSLIFNLLNSDDSAIKNSAQDLNNQTQETIDTNKKASEKRKQKIELLFNNDDPRDNVIFTDVLTNIDNYMPTDEASDGRLESKVSVILTVITNIGMILAVLMVAILGVKYMLGSVEEKAEYKKDMIPYLVGACLLFGITVIVKVLQQIGQSINNI